MIFAHYFRPTRFAGSFSVAIGLIVVLLFFLINGAIAYWNIHTIDRDATEVMQTHNVIVALGDFIAVVKDAETGQRGYLLTEDETYLEPYMEAISLIEEQLRVLENTLSLHPQYDAELTRLKAHAHQKMTEMKETIDISRTRGFAAAIEIVLSDRGKDDMEAIRRIVAEIREDIYNVRTERMQKMRDEYQLAIISSTSTALLGILIALIVARLIHRVNIERQRERWLQEGKAGLNSRIIGDQRLDELGDNILSFLAEYFNAQAGAFYAAEGKSYRRVATYGVPADARIVERFAVGDGLLGQAVKDRRAFLIHDVPEGYLTIGTALGQKKPRHLVVAPAYIDKYVNAVFELGLLQPLNDDALELLRLVSESVGIAVQSAHYRSNLQELLEETQRQSEELQSQSEELRVNNEELEEQSRALKESQTRMEQQQAELEQNNAQLEEQSQILENQRDDLARAKAILQLKAQELEQASQYKSDFLANMSHELRTPLNSSLILAKLLADNPEGNLTEEQVKFANTIQSAGNDLLGLINDILDLSKIEAGHMEIRPEKVTLDKISKDITRIFEPMAQQKNLGFAITVDSRCPRSIITDRQRLEQILKNLLSNAIKFTEKGRIDLSVTQPEKGQIAFTVRDTGIGIPSDQQQIIFDAFRQADGTISRKYGGTGLGLSICRELTRLLGGKIHLTSKAGEGSQFTIVIPHEYNPELVVSRQPIKAATDLLSDHDSLPMPSETDRRPVKSKHSLGNRPYELEDDRESLNGNQYVILVVEDDLHFAKILYDLAHEMNFQCLLTSTAEEALEVAQYYLPHAVVLDVGLPDHSGLSVLDRLKQSPRTRHIPIHIVSANDYTQTALSLGAAGYMIKPVKREDIMETLTQLQNRVKQEMSRILVVEDDAVQRDSVCQLLRSSKVETVGVGSASECLQQLKSKTFDCMVLDLALPDATGYSLLETLSQEDAYSFPPVIVYTGRDLSREEEQRLRRYSSSIIIKGAKSPERLLDEVTLFMHQVVSDLPPEQQRLLKKAQNRDAILHGRRILIVEDDIRNVYAITSIFEPRGAVLEIARNGREALEMLSESQHDPAKHIDLVLMDVMMPEMDGLTATRELRKQQEWKKLPIIMLTAKAMKDDQQRCLDAGANDYIAKPLDVEKLLSLVRVWMPR
jgi:CheY-like chemotaxis protein/CHASE3 domain sensor protein